MMLRLKAKNAADWATFIEMAKAQIKTLGLKVQVWPLRASLEVELTGSGRALGELLQHAPDIEQEKPST